MGSSPGTPEHPTGRLLATARTHDTRPCGGSGTRSNLTPVETPGLWNIARDTPDRTAVVGPDGTTLTYAELTARADRYGRGFQALGLRPGDTVALMLPNGVDLVAVYFAAAQTGLYVVPVNWHLVGPEVAYLLTDSGAG